MSRSAGVWVIAVALMILLAGCAGLPLGGSTPQATETGTPQPEPTATGTPWPTEPFTLMAEPTTGTCASSVGFWSSNQPATYGYTQRSVRFAFTLERNASVVSVAFEGNRTLGAYHFRTESPIAGGGLTITFEEALEGRRTVHIVTYDDVNGNEAFDRGVDRPCFAHGEVVRTDPQTFDFGSFPATETAR